MSFSTIREFIHHVASGGVLLVAAVALSPLIAGRGLAAHHGLPDTVNITVKIGHFLPLDKPLPP